MNICWVPQKKIDISNLKKKMNKEKSERMLVRCLLPMCPQWKRKKEKKESKKLNNVGSLPITNVSTHLLLGDSSSALSAPAPPPPDSSYHLPANKLALSWEWGRQCYGHCLRTGTNLSSMRCPKKEVTSDLIRIWHLLLSNSEEGMSCTCIPFLTL